MCRTMRVFAAGVVAFGMLGASQAHADRSETPTKAAGVTFRAAMAQSAKGFEAMSLDDGATVYVAPRVAFSHDEVVTSLFSGARQLDLALTPEAAERLNRVQADYLAMFVDGRLATVANLETVKQDGSVTLSDVSESARQRLSRALGAGSVHGPVMRVVPQQASASPGDIVTVEVFLEGATEVRTFQAALDAVGGRSGKLIREPGHIDHQRSDFIHAGYQTLPAVDDTRGRFGATTLDTRGADAIEAKYLGSFDYRVSDDASGTFVVKIRMGQDAFIMDEANEYLPLAAINATITVKGTRRPTR